MPSFGLTAFETTTGKQAELLVDNGELRVSGSSSEVFQQRLLMLLNLLWLQ